MLRWDIFSAWHTPAKYIGEVEAVDADAAIKEAAKILKITDDRKLIALRRQ